MPQNKNALIRYRTINSLLVNKGGASMHEIRQKCAESLYLNSISESTIKKDIKAMREDSGLGFYAPIEYDRADNKYYYSKKGYSIDKIPINMQELNSLEFVGQMLEQYKNVHIFNSCQQAIQKLQDAIRISRLANNKGPENFIEFEQAVINKGSEYLEELFESIKNRKVIRISYQAFQRGVTLNHLIHPYFLKEYRNRWYILGYHDKYREIRIFALDRMKEIEFVENVKYIHINFDPKEYFKNSIGIIAFDSSPHFIKLKLSNTQLPYIQSRPLHESQDIIEEYPEYSIISLKTHITYELVFQILGWNSNVEVIEPEFFRKQIIELIDKMAKIYSNHQ